MHFGLISILISRYWESSGNKVTETPEGAFFASEGASGCIVSIIQSNAKKEPIIDTIVSVIGSFSMPGYWL